MEERPTGDQTGPAGAATRRTSQATKPPTMEDVAERAGVSRALVSIVFRDLPGASPANRERVRRAADEIGFRPDRRASLLGRKRTNLLGVAFGVGHEFHADLIAALYTAAAQHRLEIVLSGITDDRSEQQAVAELLAFRCDALVLLGPTLDAAALAALAETAPVVALARAVEAPGVDVVRTDDERGARMATEYLLGLGHRTIVHLDGRGAPGGAERRRGFRSALRAADPAGQAVLYPGGLTEADGAEAARLYLARLDRATLDPARLGRPGPAHDDPRTGDPIPTAVFAFNDRCAIGFLATVRAAGVRVPEDVSLVGYDDSRIANASWTQLTTVAQDTAALAQGAIARARERIEQLPSVSGEADSGSPGARLILPALMIRRTTGVPGSRRL